MASLSAAVRPSEVTLSDMISSGAYRRICRVERLLSAARDDARRRRTEIELSRLSDAQLADIGVDRAAIGHPMRGF